jgi:Phosphate transport regulator (distant homolog of PhoU)
MQLFKFSKEDMVFQKLQIMTQDIKTAISKLHETYNSVKRGDRDAYIGEMVRIKTVYEHVAMVREEVLSALYGEAFLPDFKESMVMLSQAIYDTSKAVKDTARALTFRRVSEKCLTMLTEQIEAYLSLVEEASSKLSLMVSQMSNDIGEAIKTGREIQILERSGDEIKDSLLTRLYELESQTDVISILQLKDVILFMDDILDFMEEATMSVEVFYATLKS